MDTVTSIIRMLIYFLLLFICQSSFAQDLSQLSDKGYGHWNAAVRLSESASSVDDFLAVANEYQSVLVSDSSFIPTYMPLVHIYEKIALEKGPFYLDKATEVLDLYLKVKPEDSRIIESERIYIQALVEKSKRNVPKGFVGKWQYMGLNITEDNGSYNATVTSPDNKVCEVISVVPEEEHMIIRINEIDDGIASGQLKYDNYWKEYKRWVHRCHGKKDYYYTKEISREKYLLWNEGGRNYIALIHHDDDYYSSEGKLIHSCSYSYDKSHFKVLLEH